MDPSAVLQLEARGMKDGGKTGTLIGTCSQTRPAKTCLWHAVNSCRAT